MRHIDKLWTQHRKETQKNFSVPHNHESIDLQDSKSYSPLKFEWNDYKETDLDKINLIYRSILCPDQFGITDKLLPYISKVDAICQENSELDPELWRARRLSLATQRFFEEEEKAVEANKSRFSFVESIAEEDPLLAEQTVHYFTHINGGDRIPYSIKQRSILLSEIIDNCRRNPTPQKYFEMLEDMIHEIQRYRDKLVFEYFPREPPMNYHHAESVQTEIRLRTETAKAYAALSGDLRSALSIYERIASTTPCKSRIPKRDIVYLNDHVSAEVRMRAQKGFLLVYMRKFCGNGLNGKYLVAGDLLDRLNGMCELAGLWTDEPRIAEALTEIVLKYDTNLERVSRTCIASISNFETDVATPLLKKLLDESRYDKMRKCIRKAIILISEQGSLGLCPS